MELFKSKDKVSGLVNVLTVTKNSEGAIVVNRSTETDKGEEELAAYNLAVLSHEMDYYWIIPFDTGVATKVAGGPVTISCFCATVQSEESTGNACAEEFNVASGKVTCKANSCGNCDMMISAASKKYKNTGGYLIIEATAVIIE